MIDASGPHPAAHEVGLKDKAGGCAPVEINIRPDVLTNIVNVLARIPTISYITNCSCLLKSAQQITAFNRSVHDNSKE